ncbi:hypothetical protein [Flavobacterium sp.]|uniref:hypothetical protein n=1 Tax=Flavobacterium sp. TaxID=239 RepID=UPI00260D3B68|nr:hypothetical protein [Flavobacterium sp.]
MGYRKEVPAGCFTFEPLTKTGTNESKELRSGPTLTFGLFSCKGVSYYQIYKTKSSTITTTTDKSMRYEDSQCRIDYNLWADKGNAGFTFYNKTEETIHILLDESFYVLNGMAYDYYQNRSFTTSQATVLQTSSSLGLAKMSWLSLYNSASKTTTTGNTNAVTVTEAKVIAVPPKTARVVSEFEINRTLFRDCELVLYPSSRQVKARNFSEEDSPLKFYNIISYKVGTDEAVLKVKNDFYVSEIMNYPEKDVTKTVRTEFCNVKSTAVSRIFTASAPDKFYLHYVKPSNGGSRN